MLKSVFVSIAVRTLLPTPPQNRETPKELEAISAADDDTEIGFIIRKKREEG